MCRLALLFLSCSSLCIFSRFCAYPCRLAFPSWLFAFNSFPIKLCWKFWPEINLQNIVDKDQDQPTTSTWTSTLARYTPSPTTTTVSLQEASQWIVHLYQVLLAMLFAPGTMKRSSNDHHTKKMVTFEQEDEIPDLSVRGIDNY